jgi:hypothetical protein
MTHFLARLAERARGTVPRVEPLIASHLAPSDLSGSDTVSEITTEIEARAPAKLPSESKPVSRPAGPVPAENATQSLAAEPTSAEEGNIEIPPEPLLIPQVPQHSQPLVVRQTQIERQVVEHRSGSAAFEKQPPKPKTRRRKSHEPAQQPLPREHIAFSFAPEPRVQAPIVRVTIGRIDVRAAPTPAPSPRKPVGQVGPTLTLDAYLKERKEGRR